MDMLSFWMVIFLYLVGVQSVDRSKFRRCDQTLFCRRYRDEERKGTYSIIEDTIQLKDQEISFDLSGGHPDPSSIFRGKIIFYEHGAIRFRVTEKNPLYGGRWEPNDILQHDLMTSGSITELRDGDTKIPENIKLSKDILGYKYKASKQYNDVVVILNVNPFRIDVYKNGELVITTNRRGLLHFEHHIKKEEKVNKSAISDDQTEDIHQGKKIVDYGEDGLAIYEDGTTQQKVSEEKVEVTDTQENQETWEERFDSHVDSKPFGPASLGIDIGFPGSLHVYGIPEHASDLSLKTTKGEGSGYTEPYRLYNLDVFEYELDVSMALYGSIPFMLAHNSKITTGVYWNNPTETFVDIVNTKDTNMGESQYKSTHWISESGVMDIFFLVGPTPSALFKQYSTLTGFTQLPPMFSIAYHQCRWNYKNEQDVKNVNDGFEQNIIPYDVLWLDIEHTNGKRYFTWDEHQFPTPEYMLNNISYYGRKMVTIVDPHIKRDDNYHVHVDATKDNVYIKDTQGNDFDGWCWPGSSSYVDFTNPRAREWWAEQFSLDKYKGSTVDLYTWNDMNEPSVFNGPEVSMSKDIKNLDGIEHREWHNLYGYYMQRATGEGQIKRSANSRPFVLSRAFFAGSQKYGAIWTGDNAAEWSHLDYATKMLLSISVAGLPFIGADVGGFFKDGDTELLTRWYQAAAYQPFFRAHAHHDSKRREPWLFGEPHTTRFSSAIRSRYALLPYVYTLFYISQLSGVPVMRPMWVEYPSDTNTFAIDNQFLLGSDLLVHPIVGPGITSAKVYFPKGSMWYNVHTYQVHKGSSEGVTENVQAPIEYTPAFQRGGSIIAKKMRVRRNSLLMFRDPYTLYVALDENKEATGILYLDDEKTFEYKNKYYRVREFLFKDNILSSKSSVGSPRLYSCDNTIERIIVIGYGKEPSDIILTHAPTSKSHVNKPINFKYDADEDTITLRKPKIHAAYDWKILLK